MKIAYEDELVTLYHGDYRDARDLEKADAVITDPPYGETKLVWDQWVPDWPLHASELSTQLWSFGSARMFWEHQADFVYARWKLAQDVVWEKHNGSSLRNDRFRRVHELAYHFYRGRWDALYHVTPTTNDAIKRTVRRKDKPTHLGNIKEQTYLSEDGGPRLVRSVIKARSEHGRAIHRTQKALGIVAPLIEYSVPPGGLVVDLFAGSATVAIAARMQGRRCIAFEVDEDTAASAARRLSQQGFTW